MSDPASSIAIRLAAEADVTALARLGATTFIETFGHLYSRENLDAFVKESHATETYEALIHDPRCQLWLAEASGEPVAYAVAGPCGLPVKQPGAFDGELKRLYVARAYQNAGLGQQLLEPALAWLKQHFNPVYISVYAENYGAQRLYQRFGFVEHGRYEFMVGDHADPELMLVLAS
jgi:ribosomal protein S18 acetylase RimI-like enzyme